MCGICGELTFESGAAVDAGTLLVDARSPGASRARRRRRLCVSRRSARRASAFRRLAIIDLSAAANQPMPNEDGSVQVVFNGEIYNFKRAARRPGRAGPPFPTDADTEVIVHLYEEQRRRLRRALDGMFAHRDLGRARGAG